MIRRLLSLVLALILGACDRADVVLDRESGDEIPNTLAFGELKLTNDEPAPKAQVTLKGTGSRKDSIFATLFADSRGRYRFTGLEAGEYRMLAKWSDGALESDTLVAYRAGIRIVSGESTDVGVDTLRRPGSISIHVYTSAGPAAGALCSVPGFGAVSITDTAGGCLLAGLAPTVYSARVDLREYLPVTVDSIQVRSGSTTRVDTVLLESDPGAALPSPTGVKAECLEEEGIIRIRWDAVNDSNLSGYRLYRSVKGEASGISIAPVGLASTRWDDSLFRHLHFADSIGYGYEYQVASVTKRKNPSRLSMVASVDCPPLWNLPASARRTDSAASSIGIVLERPLQGEKINVSPYADARGSLTGSLPEGFSLMMILQEKSNLYAQYPPLKPSGGRWIFENAHLASPGPWKFNVVLCDAHSAEWLSDRATAGQWGALPGLSSGMRILASIDVVRDFPSTPLDTSAEDSLAPSSPLASSGDRVFVFAEDAPSVQVTASGSAPRRGLHCALDESGTSPRTVVIQHSTGAVEWPQGYWFYYQVTGDIRAATFEVKDKAGIAEIFSLPLPAQPGWRKAKFPGLEKVDSRRIFETLIHISGSKGGIDICGFADPDRATLP